MKSGIAAATLIALSGGMMMSAQAQENEQGFYIGGGFGQFNVQIDDVDDTDNAIERLDDDDRAWKLFGGYRFNPHIALELAYIDFGDASDSTTTASGSSGDYSVGISGLAPYVIGTLPLGPVELFGKVGYYFYDLDIDADLDDLGGNVFDTSDSGEDLLYGFGVGMTFIEHLHARLEYEKIEADDIDDADAIWLSGAWRF
jgi:OOP family OmpA-OmpF porin